AKPGGGRRSRGHRLPVPVRPERLSCGAACAPDGAVAGGADGEHDPVSQLQGSRPAQPPIVPRPRHHRRGHRRLLDASEGRPGHRRVHVSGVRLYRAGVVPIQAACATGSVILTVVPAPFTLVTAIVPPVSSIFRFAIVRPRPVPVALVEKYGSKILATASASMPRPVSAISTATRGSGLGARKARIVTPPPPGIAWSAFSMMLVRARAKSVRSMNTGGSV